MANISSLGLGSGIDAESIISKLMSIEQQPITNKQAENTKLNTKLSEWGKLQSNFSALKDAAKALTTDSFWSATTSKSSDESVVTVATGTDSVAGSYSIAVQSLAQAQYVASSTFTDKTAVIGEGTLTIELGTFNGTPVPPTFTAVSGVSAIGITIGPGDNTMEKIRDKINAANTGVTATLITDASGARLVLRGKTGEESGFRVTVEDSDGNNTDGAGLSALAFDPSNSISNMTQTQAAANAKATINGISVSSSTNTLSNVVDGLTLKLGKVSATPVDVTVNQDTDSVKKGVDTFVTAYNAIVSEIRTQSKYDENTKTAGILNGDSTATGLLSQIRNLASGSSGASSVFTRLSDAGFSIAKEGTLSLDSAKWTKSIANLSELKKFFANSDSANSANDGIAERFRKLASLVTDADGTITNRQDGIRSTIKRNESKISDLTDRNSLTETRLRKQYTALDESMAKLNGLSSYVTNQLAAMNKTTSSG